MVVDMRDCGGDNNNLTSLRSSSTAEEEIYVIIILIIDESLVALQSSVLKITLHCSQPKLLANVLKASLKNEAFFFAQLPTLPPLSRIKTARIEYNSTSRHQYFT